MKFHIPAARLIASVTVVSSLVAAPVAAQENPQQRAIAAVRKALEQHPGNATLYYYLAVYQARAKDKAGALESLGRVLELGDGFLPPRDSGFENLEQDADFLALRAALDKKQRKIADAPVVFRIADTTFIPEGIAYDAPSKSFFVGSIYQKRIVRIGADGRMTPFSQEADGLQHVLGIAIDQPRRLLYAISTSAMTAEGRKQAFNAVVRYDLNTGKRNGEYRLPEARQLNDVTVAPNGDVYASDSRSGAIWRAFVDNEAKAAFVPAGLLRGTNGIAVSDDGKTLYAGHSMGVARIDIATGGVDDMPSPPQANVAAIDGLYYHRGELLGVQNGTHPGRVIRMRLASNGTAIDSVETLQSHHHPAFDEPTTGAVADDGFYVLATTQVARFNARGELDDAATLKQPAVVRVPLTK
ncbi:MAG TPA: SMP-30/gluconolactonase/LRE family protein [Paucimonas sp.]|nr:SMP-30/gluconolactonase/LRE family protein [Paucimonas sp.]